MSVVNKTTEFVLKCCKIFQKHSAFETINLSLDTTLSSGNIAYNCDEYNLKFKVAAQPYDNLVLKIATSLRKIDEINLCSKDENSSGFSSIIYFEFNNDYKDCEIIIQLFWDGHLCKIYNYDIKAIRILILRRFRNDPHIEIRK